MPSMLGIAVLWPEGAHPGVNDRVTLRRACQSAKRKGMHQPRRRDQPQCAVDRSALGGQRHKPSIGAQAGGEKPQLGVYSLSQTRVQLRLLPASLSLKISSVITGLSSQGAPHSAAARRVHSPGATAVAGATPVSNASSVTARPELAKANEDAKTVRGIPERGTGGNSSTVATCPGASTPPGGATGSSMPRSAPGETQPAKGLLAHS